MITHIIAGAKLDIEIVTLDTGRMFPESYTLWRDTEAKYGVAILPFIPGVQHLSARLRTGDRWVLQFAGSASCLLRSPQGRAAHARSEWRERLGDGLRADASANRAGMEAVSYDGARDLVKFSPLFDWTRERIAAFAAEHDVPVSPLHARGFLSIGCAPCTRAIQPGEPERAGRWWWEQAERERMRSHVDADGRMIRARSAPQDTSETLHR